MEVRDSRLPTASKWRQRRLCKIESELFERQMDEQKEAIDAHYKSYDEVGEHTYAFRMLSHSVALQMLNRMESRLERTYSRALNDLLRLRRLRESKPGPGNSRNEKRTQSQDRTPVPNPQVGQASWPVSEPETSDPVGVTQ